MNFIWLLILINIIFGISFAYKSKKITYLEFLIVSICVWLIMLLVYTAYYHIRLSDRKFINDKIISFRYEGPWVSKYSCCKMYRRRCSGSGKKRSCYSYCALWGTCYKNEGDYYEYTTKQNGIHHVSEKEAKSLIKKYFTGPKKVIGKRPSYHKGDKYDYYWKVNENTIVPWTTFTTYKNYIAPSENIIKGNTSIGEDVEEHPVEKYIDNLYHNKVIGIELDPYKLAIINSSFSNTANLIIYGFKNGTLSQCENLKAKWIGGKVNDLVLCIIHDDIKINNIKVFGWTENELIKSELETLLLNVKLNDFYKKSTQIIDIINKNYIENSMDKYNYLTVKIRNWDYVLLLFFYLLFVGFGWWLAYNNDINDKDL